MDKNEKEHLIGLIWLLVATALLVSLILSLGMLSGCSLLPVRPDPDVIPEPDQLIQVVKQTNWLATLSIIGIGAGFFSFLNGGTRGLQAMASCFVILSIVLGVAKYSAWIAGVSMVGGVCLMAYTIFVKNRALKEVVKGSRWFMADTWPDAEKEFLRNQDVVQSPLTKKLVDEIQKSLGAK